MVCFVNDFPVVFALFSLGFVGFYGFGLGFLFLFDFVVDLFFEVRELVSVPLFALLFGIDFGFDLDFLCFASCHWIRLRSLFDHVPLSKLVFLLDLC